MLRIVHPAPRGQGTDPPKRRKGSRSASLMLTVEERQHLRAALKNLRRRLGSWPAVAEAVGVDVGTLHHAAGARGTRGGLALAVRAAKVARVPVEAMLSGKLADADRCPTCGVKIGGAP